MKRALSVFIAVTCLAVAASAGGPGRDFLVTPDWLAEHLEDPSVVVLQAADIRADYEREHIPGARFLWIGWIAESTPDLNAELFPVSKLDSLVERLGVSDDTIVVLAHTYSRGSLSAVMRTFATLEHLGMGRRTVILDGGFEAWKNAGKPTTQEVPEVARGNFTPTVKPHVFVDAEYVKARMNEKGVRLVDSRRPADYKGDPESVRPSGHIPGAVNVSYSSIVDDHGAFMPADTLRARFAEAGIEEGDELITYCFRGMAAAYVYVAAVMLGYEAHIYDGSMEEWGGSDLPVETSAKKE